MSTAAVRRYWTRLVADGCWNDGRPAQVAHAHSGSIREAMQEPKAKGKKLARYDWLVIPLCPECHQELDAGVEKWEEKYLRQDLIIDSLERKHRLPLWELAKGDKRSLPTIRGAACDSKAKDCS